MMKSFNVRKVILTLSGMFIIALLSVKLPSWAVKTRIEHTTYKEIGNNTCGFGVAQPTESKLQEIMQRNDIKPEHLILIDLRGEPHIFINDYGYYLERQPFDNIQALFDYEEKLVDNINAGIPVEVKERVASMEDGKRVVEYLPLEVPAESTATTEQRIAKKLGVHYIRIANNDGEVPTMDNIYTFIRIIAPLLKDPNNRFVIHCYAGLGRTSFFATVLDILVNARRDTFDTILARQAEKFEKDFAAKKEVVSKKARVLYKVYDYIRNNTDDFATPPTFEA